ncbi:MAG: hypothetical protein AAB619_02680 [Patescibacteria group bacterium]
MTEAQEPAIARNANGEPRRLTNDELLRYTKERLQTMTPEEVVDICHKLEKRLSFLELDVPPPTIDVNLSPDEAKKQLIQRIDFFLRPRLTEYADSRRDADQRQEQKHEHHLRELSGARTLERLAQWQAAAVTTEPRTETERAELERLHRQRGDEGLEKRDMYEFTKKSEPVIAAMLEVADSLGGGATYVPASEHEDLASGADIFATIAVNDGQGGTHGIKLGLDYTVTKKEEIQRDKLLKNFRRPTREVLHSTIGHPDLGQPGLQRGDRFIGVLLAVHKERVEQMFDDLNVMEVGQPFVPDKVRQLTNEYRRDPLLRYVIPWSIHEQLKTQLDLVRRRPRRWEGGLYEKTAADLQLLIDHFGRLLEGRKKLRGEAEQIVNDFRLSDVYRVGNPGFHADVLRSLPPREYAELHG